ncbi:hypothetical protein E1286_26160 [Nonomuraea terrae]|uniref:Uncharacterized protein n=1 Tax=Nonomuraea terrae TaxID=2530383 RepID=A0A4V2YL25_9ACTN|nr:hypothetical protein [Nonomuraea terrae]TDD44717.1 hypothetical protein E1286_26160 [Nonomuraea terrae]
MNPGSEYEQPTTPPQGPGAPFGPPNMPPRVPPDVPQNTPPRTPPRTPPNVPGNTPPGGPPQMPHTMPPSGPQQMPPGGSHNLPPSGPQGMPPHGPWSMPMGGPQNVPPSGPQNVPPGWPQNMPPGGPPGMPPGGPPGMGPGMPPPPQGPQYGQPPVQHHAPPNPPSTLRMSMGEQTDALKARPTWLLPSLAALFVVLIAATGVGAYLLSGGDAPSDSPPSADGDPAPARPAATAAAGPDVCAMLPKDEADRLVPDATVSRSSRENENTVDFSCNWLNRRISFGEYWRDREIDVKIAQHKGDGAKTGRAMAQNSYEIDYGSARYGATAKPSLDPEEKEQISQVKDIPGVGDGAFAQYTWRRDDMLWYAFGTAYARVGDMTMEVKFQAGQQRKDAEILSNETTQAITEANAIREVSGLVKHFAKGAADWQARNPNVLAKPEATPSATTSPTPRATPSPTVLASFPAECAAMSETAIRLVPEATTRARGTAVGNDNQTECRWLNRELSGGPGITKIRSALITVHRFTNRAGAIDEPAAKAFYTSQFGSAKNTAESSIGRIVWGKLTEVDGLGDQAYRQFTQIRQGEVSASSGSVVMRKGAVVVQIDYSGQQRPEGETTDSPKVELMTEKEALAGAHSLASAYQRVLNAQPTGS